MSVIDFIENGAKVPNPNYKKGSKNPLAASPYLVSNNPKDYITPSSISAKNIAQNTYGLTEFDIKENKYDEYDVIVNPNATKEELDLQRAKNQSGIEQFGNALGQIVENEILLGTALGISNLVDWAANKFKDEPNDFTNEVSTFFEDLQNKNRERLAIYQENPDKSWQVGDWGWWMNNLVSVGSTVSLMIPSMGVAKGLSLLGKIPLVSKAALNVTKAIANIGNRVDKGKKLLFKPHSFVTNAGHFIENSTAALASRIGEGYMEARDTYTSVYEKALDELSNLSDEDRADLIERNPDYANMTDDEIAKDLASISGANTFKEDFPLVLIDFMQYKSINNLFKNKLKNGAVNARARLEHKNTMRKLAGQAEEEITALKVFKEGLLYNVKNPQNIIKSIPFSEGFEEGYQGIVQSRSEELYNMAMDPKVSLRSIQSYLTDGHIWEQAFWGIIGGAVFEGVGSAASTVKSEIDRVKQNKRLSKENQKQKLANEKARSNDISSRFTKMDAFIKKMKALNEGWHYEETINDKQGNPIIINGVTQYRQLTEEEVFYEKEKLINEFADEMVMQSIDNGTYELTKEFIESDYFDKYFSNKGMSQSDVDTYIKDRFQNRLESTKDAYLKNLDILTTIIDNPYYHSLQLAARDLTRRGLAIEAYDDAIANIDSKLQEAGELDRLSDSSYDLELINVINHNLNILDKHESQLFKNYDERKISKVVLDESIEELNKSRIKFYRTLSQIKSQNEQINEIKKNIETLLAETDLNKAVANLTQEANKITQTLFGENVPIVTNTTKELLRNRAINEIKKELDIYNLPVDEESIKELYSDLDYSLTQLAYERLDKAFKLVEDYMMNAENPEEAFDDLMISLETLPQNVLNALEVLKLSAKNGNVYYKGLLKVKEEAIAKQQQDAIEADRVLVNNEDVAEETKEEVRHGVQQVIDDAQQVDDYSTGEQDEDLFAQDLINQAGEDYQRELAEQRRELSQDDPYFSGQTYGLDLVFNNFIVNHVNKKQYIDIIKNIKQVDFSDSNYKKIFEVIVDELVLSHGLSERDANQIANNEIQQILQILAIQNSTNPSLKQKYSILAKQLQYGVRLDGSNETLSATSIIEDTEAKFKIIDDIIELYKEENKITGEEFDVDKFFEFILSNEDINYRTASLIFNYFTDYLLDRRIQTTNSYVFDKFRNNANDFFNNLRLIKAQRESVSDYMHIPASTRKADNYDLAIEAAKRGEKVYLRQDPKNTSVMQIMCMGVEIGYLTKTKTTNETNTRFKKLINTRGLNWEVTKTQGGYSSNYDEFFKALFDKNNKEAQELLKILRNPRLRNDVELVRAAIADVPGGNLILEETDRQSKGKNYTTLFGNIKEILKIADYSRESDPYFSYQSWLEKVYNNYVQTKEIQDIVEANQENTILVDFKSIGIQTPNYVKENVDVSSQPFVAEQNTVIAVDKNGQIITEKGSHQFNSATIFNTGTMGMLLHNANGNPIIARFAEANGVTKNTELYKALYDYLTDIFTQYQTNENYTINNLYEDLLELLVLRKDKNDTEFNPLFNGYTLVKINGGIAVAKALPYGQKEGKTPFVLAIYDKKYTKKDYEGEAGATRSYTLFNEEGKPYANMIDGIRVSFSTHNPEYIHYMVEDIISGLKFNRSLTFLTNRNEKNVKTNKHFYKENGKLYVELGNKKIEYDSYFQFIMKNNAFKVNVQSKNGSFTTNTSESNDFYISVSRIEKGKSEYELANPQSKIEDGLNLIQSATNTKPVSVLSVMELLGLDTSTYSPWVEKGLFTDELYFDSNSNHKGHASNKNGKIKIRAAGINMLRNHPQEFTRLMVHEELHIKLEQANAFERQELIKDLLDTYEQFVKAVEEKATQGNQQAITLKKWIEKNNFKPNKQFIKNDVGDRQFAEEWLVESITNQPITNLLNEIMYEGNIETKEKKSILQHIIELILNLLGFDFDNINKSSILAKQISLLNDKTLQDVTPITTDENGDTNISSPVEGNAQPEQTTPTSETTPENNQVEEEELVDYVSDEFDDFLSATIPVVDLETESNHLENALNNFADNNDANPNGYIMIADMEDFVKSYPVNIQPKIRKLMNTGMIKFICR